MKKKCYFLKDFNFLKEILLCYVVYVIIIESQEKDNCQSKCYFVWIVQVFFYILYGDQFDIW